MAVPALLDDRELARLMVSAQAGDRVAYAQVLGGCVDIIAGLGGDGRTRPSVDEMVVEACLRTIHAARHTFDPRRSFVLWVTAIARHHGLSPRTDPRPDDGDRAYAAVALNGWD